MLQLQRIQKQIDWVIKQIMCIKDGTCSCGMQPTSLEWDDVEQELTASFANGEIHTVEMPLNNKLESGDNISELNNDLGYITIGDLNVNNGLNLDSNTIKLGGTLTENTTIIGDINNGYGFNVQGQTILSATDSFNASQTFFTPEAQIHTSVFNDGLDEGSFGEFKGVDGVEWTFETNNGGETLLEFGYNGYTLLNRYQKLWIYQSPTANGDLRVDNSKFGLNIVNFGSTPLWSNVPSTYDYLKLGKNNINFEINDIESVFTHGFDGVSNIEINNRGIRYDIDYTVDWDNLTDTTRIPTKGYIDRKFTSGTNQFKNGINKNNNIVKLGGPLTENTTITGNFELNLGNDVNNENLEYIRVNAVQGEEIYSDSYPSDSSTQYTIITKNPGGIGTTVESVGDDSQRTYVNQDLGSYRVEIIDDSNNSASNLLMGSGSSILNSTDNTTNSEGFISTSAGGNVTLNSSNENSESLSLELDFPNGGGATFTDTRSTPKGLEYSEDYSSTYSDRSLVDKEFVSNTLNSELGDYLPLTGGTLTGQLNANGGLRVNGTTSDLWFSGSGISMNHYRNGVFLFQALTEEGYFNWRVNGDSTDVMTLGASGQLTLIKQLNANGGVVVNQGNGYFSNLIDSQLYSTRDGSFLFRQGTVGGYYAWRVNGDTTNVMTLGANGQLTLTEELTINGNYLNHSSTLNDYFITRATRVGGYFVWRVNGSSTNVMRLDSNGQLTLTEQLNANVGIVVGSGDFKSKIIGNELQFFRPNANYIRAKSVGGFFNWSVNGDTNSSMILGANGLLSLTKQLNANGGIVVNQGQGYYSQLVDNQLIFNRGNANYINANGVGGYLRWRTNGSGTTQMQLGTNGQLTTYQKLNAEGGVVVNKSVVSGYSEIPSNGLIDLSLSNHYNFTISSDITFSFSNLPNKNMTFKLRIITGGIGNYTPTINTSNVDIKYISLDVNETVGEVTQWWCDYNYVDNTIYINSVSGFIAL